MEEHSRNIHRTGMRNSKHTHTKQGQSILFGVKQTYYPSLPGQKQSFKPLKRATQQLKFDCETAVLARAA